MPPSHTDPDINYKDISRPATVKLMQVALCPAAKLGVLGVEQWLPCRFSRLIIIVTITSIPVIIAAKSIAVIITMISLAISTLIAIAILGIKDLRPKSMGPGTGFLNMLAPLLTRNLASFK